MTSEARDILAHHTHRRTAYVDELRQLCAIDCPTSHKAGVDEAGAWVRRWVSGRGWDVRAWSDSQVGDSLLVSHRGGNPTGARILLAAHLDTVYPLGTAGSRPLHREGDRLLAPGVADNKSGLLSALHAMAALDDLEMMAPFAEVGLFCGGDEETDMLSSVAALTELRPSYDTALVLEAGRENGDIVAARKGGGRFILHVTGKAAHAGVEPHLGASAIVALAQGILGVHLLNGKWPGVTVNVGTVHGGSVVNVVPATATAEIDARITSPAQASAVETALYQIAGATHVPGTHARLEGGWLVPPMPRSPAGDQLVAIARACAGELEITLGAAETGGVSYANHLTAIGLPVIDGLAPIGGLDHSPDEYILESSIIPRTALLTLLLLRRAQTQPG